MNPNNGNAGFSEYMLSGGFGGAIGGLNAVGSIAGLGSGLIGAGIGAQYGNASLEFQIGDMVCSVARTMWHLGQVALLTNNDAPTFSSYSLRFKGRWWFEGVAKVAPPSNKLTRSCIRSYPTRSGLDCR